MEAIAVSGLPEVTEADQLADLILAHSDITDGDILCIASSIVSKAEGRRASLDEYPPGPRATEIASRLSAISGDEKDPRFAQAVLEESTEIIMEAPFLLTETRFGHIGVNAGIDRSNTGSADLLLLPRQPSASAARIRDKLPADVAVIITDTSGRPFRHGQTGVAIGWAGIPASRDWRGESDRDAYELDVTVQTVVDELAATANLVMGEGNAGTPVVRIRDWTFGDHTPHEELFRSVSSDFVRQALRDWTYEDS